MNESNTASSLSRVVYFSALYDLIVTAPMATPWTAQWLSNFLNHLHNSQQLSGMALSLDNPFTMLFVNLMGSIVVVWSLVRLRSPQLILGAADTVGRLLFSTWMLYAIFHGASAILWHFLAAEMLWAIVQGITVWRSTYTSRIDSLH